MKIIRAENKDINMVYDLIQSTIREIYIKYYTNEVVEFFSNHHSIKNIDNDIKKGNVYLLIDNDSAIGTGTLIDNHITRVFILPKYQHLGYGNMMMQYLENLASNNYNTVILDSSLAACVFYEKRGYKAVKHETINVSNGKFLVYEIMEKKINKCSTIINYNNRKFIPKMNTSNGEVDNNTIFKYHQNDNILWAEYFGGDILKGSIMGIVLENGELDFYYHHINLKNKIRVGKCHSIPNILNDGKLELKEEWQWLNGDLSKGESLLIEI